jgi:adenylate cyclase
LSRLFAELKRRNVIRMAGLYLVGAWLIVQVSETLLPLYDTPAWVMKTLVMLLAIGFLPTLVFAWVFEVTPEGIRRDAEVSPGQSIAPHTARRMDRVIIAMMVIALGYFAVDKFVLTPKQVPALAEATAPAVKPVTSANGASAPVTDNSIAVLPFVNMSSDPEQEFFSDGLSEELLNQLAQIPQLRVIARTSSFSFKGKEVDVATIAKALNVAHVLEGSVRKSVDTLRITAQLIRTSDSSHLWSKTYDRQLTDVFKIQDEISSEVVSALKVTLLPGQSVPKAQRTDNVEAYEHYLRGTAVIDRGTVMVGDVTAAELHQAIAIDPGYANAYAQLSVAQSILAETAQDLAERNDYIGKSLASAEQAILLAPDLADGYVSRGYVRMAYLQDWQGAENDFKHAVERSPSDANGLVWLSYLLAASGQFEEAIAQAHKAIEVNPRSVFAWENLGMARILGNDRKDAREAFQRAVELSPESNWSNFYLGYLDLEDGKIDSAESWFQRADGAFPLAGQAMVEFSRGNEAASQKALHELQTRFAAGFSFQIASAYAWRGQKDHAFAWLEKAREYRDAGLVRARVDPTLTPLRKDPRFDALVKALGLPE